MKNKKNDKRYYYTGNDKGTYNIYDRRSSPRRRVLEAMMGEDCVSKLVYLMNKNNFESTQ